MRTEGDERARESESVQRLAAGEKKKTRAAGRGGGGTENEGVPGREKGKKRYKVPEYLYPVCYKAPRGAGRRGPKEASLGSFHTKARIYDKGGPLTPWHLPSKLTLPPT